ncbi:MAG TPA: hypothetical protein VLN49_10735 [Gemmatimonadaceae bacterium]|nr:hypothetical protein [Gemmatimonadaceae bacterium]
MTRARVFATLSLLALATSTVMGQSTRRESLDRRPWRVEVSGGTEVGPLAGWTTTRQAGDVRTVMAAARWQSDDLLGARIGAWWIHGRNPGYDNSVDEVLAVSGAVDLAVPIPGTSFSVAPSGGLGFAPYARHHALGTSSVPQPAQQVRTASGGIWSLGLALRWRRLVLEQHVVVLFGAEEAISVNKEYYPITLGWRF